MSMFQEDTPTMQFASLSRTHLPSPVATAGAWCQEVCRSCELVCAPDDVEGGVGGRSNQIDV
jgi:hypothetical protein